MTTRVSQHQKSGYIKSQYKASLTVCGMPFSRTGTRLKYFTFYIPCVCVCTCIVTLVYNFKVCMCVGF